ncbi:hypothetical protein L7F22_052202, partial [Adiantum nelumboides]|nr:hypothetical protein [Adiantum nelumboides]
MKYLSSILHINHVDDLYMYIEEGLDTHVCKKASLETCASDCVLEINGSNVQEVLIESMDVQRGSQIENQVDPVSNGSSMKSVQVEDMPNVEDIVNDMDECGIDVWSKGMPRRQGKASLK